MTAVPMDALDLVAIAYRTGVIDRHFGRPPRSELKPYMRGYEDPDPYMPPQYSDPDRPIWLARAVKLERRAKR